jgi:hypothetical protein
MTEPVDPPLPTGGDADLALSADLDGQLDALAADEGLDAAELRARLSGSPELRSRRAQLAAARDAVARPDPRDTLDPLTRRRLVRTALARAALARAGATRRPGARAALAAAAALVAVIAIGTVAVILPERRTPDPAADRTRVVAAGVPHLGTVADLDRFTAALGAVSNDGRGGGAERAEATAAEAAPPGRSACLRTLGGTSLATGIDPTGTILYVATAADGRTLIYALRLATCEIVEARSFTGRPGGVGER